MSDRLYASTKVISIARRVLKVLAMTDMRMQDRIIFAMKEMPTAELYLSDMDSTVPRPDWIEINDLDLGLFARGEPCFDQTMRICSMAPQHKSQLLECLIDWWLTALGDAHRYQGNSLRSAAA